MAASIKHMALAVSLLGFISFILGVIAENKKVLLFLTFSSKIKYYVLNPTPPSPNYSSLFYKFIFQYIYLLCFIEIEYSVTEILNNYIVIVACFWYTNSCEGWCDVQVPFRSNSCIRLSFCCISHRINGGWISFPFLPLQRKVCSTRGSL